MSTQKKSSGARKAAPQTPVPVRFVIKEAPGVPVSLAVSGKGSGEAILVTAGAQVAILPGRYAVIGDWSPNWDRRVFCGYVYSTPPLSVDCVVVVPKGGGDIEIQARLRCFSIALGADCESYLVRGYDGYMSPLKTPCYIAGEWAVPALDINVIPTPESGRRVKNYKLVTLDLAAKDGKTLVENGKTYTFSPGPKVQE